MSVRPIPTGHPSISPYLAIRNAGWALRFYKKAFGATETYKQTLAGGRVHVAPQGLRERVQAMFGVKA